MKERDIGFENLKINDFEDLNEIEQQNFIQAINFYDLDKIYNFALSSYSLRGELNTPEVILKDLIKMPKKVVKEDFNTIYLKSKNEILHFGAFEFVVDLRFDLPQKSFVTVYLILKEPVKKAGGLFVDYDNNTIAHLILPNDENLYKTIATEFNIGGTIGGKSRTEIDYEPLNVVRAKKYLYILAGHSVYATASINKEFLDKRLETLKNSAIGKIILQEFDKLTQVMPKLSYEETIYAKNQLLSKLILRFDKLFQKDKMLFMNLKLFYAEYRSKLNEAVSSLTHEITEANFEDYNNEWDNINVKEEDSSFER